MKGVKAQKRLERRLIDYKTIKGTAGSRPNSVHKDNGQEFHRPGSLKK